MESGDRPATLGVLGGMGPAATADFLLRLTRLTRAERDQDHVPTVVYSDPRIPDRSDAILGRGPDPVPAMRVGIEFLERAGCAVIAIPCNTAHYWYEQLAAATTVPVLHIAEVTAEWLRTHAPVRRVGLLATDGTVHARIYHDRFARFGITTLDLAEGEAGVVMRGIRALKAGREAEARQTLVTAGKELIRRGAEALVVGCTDVSAALAGTESVDGVEVVDASDCLARACIDALGYARW